MDAATQAGSLAHVSGLKQHADFGMFRLKFGEDFARAVGGTVVDADEFNVEGNSEDSLDHIAQCGTLVVYGHDDGEFHGDKAPV